MRKILVVDDEHDICDFVSNFLTERGYQVLTALSGEDALAIMKKEKPELAMVDIKMKGMDGLALLKHMKSHDKNICVIMVTALEDQDSINEATRLGAFDYITKPLELEYLERVVEKFDKMMEKHGQS